MPCTRCEATPETGQGEDCPECQGIVEPLRERQLSLEEREQAAWEASVRTLGIVRRLVGCFYCGLPCRGDVCGYCSDLPLRDPLVSKARLPLSEAERMKAAG